MLFFAEVKLLAPRAPSEVAVTPLPYRPVSPPALKVRHIMSDKKTVFIAFAKEDEGTRNLFTGQRGGCPVFRGTWVAARLVQAASSVAVLHVGVTVAAA